VTPAPASPRAPAWAGPRRPRRPRARRLAWLAAALLATLAPAASALADPGPAPERIELLVTFPPWSFTGQFTLSLGGLTDHGVARDQGSLLGPGQQVSRVLEGEHGTLTLQLHGASRGGFPQIVGRWVVVAGTGAYLGLTGGGTLTAVDAGRNREDRPLGSPFELQTLLGRVRGERR